jgi:cell division protein FtsB
MEKKIKGIKIATILTCIIIFVSIIVLTLQFIKIANLKEKNNSLIEYKQELTTQINEYDATNAYFGNNRTEYLEKYARETLGWGIENDTWYTAKK